MSGATPAPPSPAAPASPPRPESPSPGGVGSFTLSIDFELAWGEVHRPRVGIERLLAARRVFPDLLWLLEQYRLPTTFAVVGHLALEGCDGHLELAGPWQAHDPRSDERRDPAFYAASLVRMLLAAPPGHDVGAHGFSHSDFDAPFMTPASAAAEHAAASSSLRPMGASCLSFVFPRNRINYPQVLKEQGFVCYRGVEPGAWAGAPRPLRRLAHAAVQALAVTPPVGVAQAALPGSPVEAPGSMLFLSREGPRRWLPMRARVARARRGLRAAAASGRNFHLWLHAEDLVPGPGLMLAGLGAVLAEAGRLREEGRLETLTMAALGRRA